MIELVFDVTLKEIERFQLNIISLDKTRWLDEGTLDKPGRKVYYNGKIDGTHKFGSTLY